MATYSDSKKVTAVSSPESLKSNECFVELPEEHQTFLRTVGKLGQALDGLVQAGRCWNYEITARQEAQEFEQSQADPRVLSRIANGEAEAVWLYTWTMVLRLKEESRAWRSVSHNCIRFSLSRMWEMRCTKLDITLLATGRRASSGWTDIYTSKLKLLTSCSMLGNLAMF